MKTFFLLLITAPAFCFASITDFQCRTNDIIESSSPTTFSFSVEGLGSGNVSYYTSDPKSYEPVNMIPKKSILNLNDNFTIKKNSEGLLLNSDGDGCQWVDVQIYQNSKYKSGYARVKDTGCGAKSAYSTISCRVTER